MLVLPPVKSMVVTDDAEAACKVLMRLPQHTAQSWQASAQYANNISETNWCLSRKTNGRLLTSVMTFVLTNIMLTYRHGLRTSHHTLHSQQNEAHSLPAELVGIACWHWVSVVGCCLLLQLPAVGEEAVAVPVGVDEVARGDQVWIGFAVVVVVVAVVERELELDLEVAAAMDVDMAEVEIAVVQIRAPSWASSSPFRVSQSDLNKWWDMGKTIETLGLTFTQWIEPVVNPFGFIDRTWMPCWCCTIIGAPKACREWKKMSTYKRGKTERANTSYFWQNYLAVLIAPGKHVDWMPLELWKPAGN